MDRKCQLRTLNEMITCKICHGYLVDATTVTECLHTFCKSCIVKHLEDSNICPECEDVIHQSHPLNYIAFDRTMQDLVYKIVPDLEDDEYKRERKFYSDRGLPCPKDLALEQESEEKKAAEAEAAMTPDANTNMDFHRFDEQVNLLLECQDKSATAAEAEGGGAGTNATPTPNTNTKNADLHLKRKFIRCSSLATVNHLKKYIAKKLLTSMDKYKDIDVMCNNEPLYKDHTLKFVYVTRWRTKDPPLKLQYFPRDPATSNEQDPAAAAASANPNSDSAESSAVVKAES